MAEALVPRGGAATACLSSPRSRRSARQLADRIPGAHDRAGRGPRRRSSSSPRTRRRSPTRSPGRAIAAVGRRGKYLLIELDDGDTLAVHLRMTGRLHWRPPGEEGEERFLRARFDLDDGSTLTFGDMRRFGRAWIVPGGPGGRPRGLLGRSASASSRSRRGSPRGCSRACSPGRRGPIKAVLLNQALVAGLGNMYVDEALFQARIHPRAPGGVARRGTRSAACTAPSATAWRAAVEAGGASIDCYRDSLGERGTMQDLLRVHLHQGDPCPRCRTTIVKTRVAQRGTYWCPHCQPEPADVVTEVAGGPRRPLDGRGGRHRAAPWSCRRRGRWARWRCAAAGRRRATSDLLAPLASVAEVTALLLSGGSAFGLDAAVRGHALVRGARPGPRHRSPRASRSCPTACIFDLGITGNARRPGPGRRLRRLRGGLRRARTRSAASAPGRAPRVGKLRARTAGARAGSAAGVRRLHDGTIVAALAVVNAWGDVIDARGEVIAGAVDQDGRLHAGVGARDRRSRRCTRGWPPPSTPRSSASSPTRSSPARGGDGRADGPRRHGARRVAGAHARSTATPPSASPPAPGRRRSSRCGVAAAEAVSDAIRDGVRTARRHPGGSDGRGSRGGRQRLASVAACRTSPHRSSTSPPTRSAPTGPWRCSC